MKKVFSFFAVALVALSASADNWCFNGNAAPTGWTDSGDPKQVNAFTKDNTGKLVWIGKMKTGGEGFKLNKTESGFGGWGDYHPSSAGLNIAEAGSDHISQGVGDTKWTISSDGIYKMTIDESTMTLTCETYVPTIKEKDGWYELGTAAELYEFAELVSHDAIPANCKAKLTADIDFTAYKYASIGRSQNFAFAGEFDGQGHTIKLDYDGIYARNGLFAYIYAAKIRNLIIDGNVASADKNCVGGLGGRSDNDGTVIENVLVKANVSYTGSNSDATAGGLFANMEGNVSVKNCSFIGSINVGSKGGCGGLIGWAGGGSKVTIENCLCMPSKYDQNDGSADFARNNPTIKNSYRVTSDDPRLATGELCYLLNNKVSGAEGWFQTLSVDAIPTPINTSAKLYANGTFYCDGVTSKGGDVVLSNTNASVVDDHVLGADGICTGCKAVGQEASLVDGVYVLENAGNVLWFSQYVNSGNPTASAVLKSDVDLAGSTFEPIGNYDNRYVGIFDGEGHSINVKIDNPTTNYQGLFGVVSDGVTIKNVTVTGSISGNSYVAGIVGAANGATSGKTVTIENCGNEAEITAAGANGAGIIGVNVNGACHFRIMNSYTAGSVHSGKEAGAITGWTGGDKSSFENVYSISEVYNGENKCEDFTRGGGSVNTNCYALEGTATNGANKTVTLDQVKSGELAYLLNKEENGGETWFQTLPTDAHPVLNASHGKIYANGELNCDGTAKEGSTITYANVNEQNRDAHTPVNGFCSECNAFMQDYLTPVDGSFELASKEDVVWFERYVYIVDNAAPAKLTADIDFEGGNTRIGTDARRYCGTFDGQGHKISNFVVDNSESFQGFFGIITGGAHISNIVMDNTCSIKAGSKSGFIGGTKGGGDVYIWRIGNEANVTVESVNAAGIIGVDEGGSATLHIDQCYTTGTIKGNAECAQICGWTGDNSTIYNSWSISPVDKIQEGRGFSRYGGTNHGSQFVNCFTTEGEANMGLTHSLSLDAFKSGEVASKLVGMFGQSLGSDEHPVFEGADVYAVTVGATGWATYVAPATVDLSNIKAASIENECYTVASIDEYVQLGYAKSVAEGEAIIVKAAEGTYYINSCNDASMDTNLLVASTEEVTCNGTQYVLAEKDGVVGFYQANGTIAAGKGYLVSGAGVKAFFFGDTATGIELTPDNGQQTTEIFNLSGQRVSKMQKGINIVNGKKVMF